MAVNNADKGSTPLVSPAVSEPTASLYRNHTRRDINSDTVPCHRMKCFYDRCCDVLEILQIVVFGMALYVVDVGSDIWCAVIHFQVDNTTWLHLPPYS